MTKQQISNESLNRAVIGQSVMNYAAIFEGFTAKGIAETDIKPRENVFTFWAWKAVGRRVRKGEHGVKATTFVAVSGKQDASTGESKSGFRMARTVTVFHISQTEPESADTPPAPSHPIELFRELATLFLATEGTPLRIANVEFWIDADGPFADTLSFSVPASNWDARAMGESVAQLARVYPEVTRIVARYESPS